MEINLNVHKYSEDKTVDSKSYQFSKLKTEDFSHRAETRKEVKERKVIQRRVQKRTRTRERKRKAKK